MDTRRIVRQDSPERFSAREKTECMSLELSEASIENLPVEISGQTIKDAFHLREHAANLGHLFPAVLATVSVVHGELLGEPSAELRAKLAGSEVPVLFTPYRSWRPGPVTRSS